MGRNISIAVGGDISCLCLTNQGDFYNVVDYNYILERVK